MSPAPQKWSHSAVRMIWPTFARIAHKETFARVADNETFARVADKGDDDGVSEITECPPPVGTQHELRQAADREAGQLIRWPRESLD